MTDTITACSKRIADFLSRQLLRSRKLFIMQKEPLQRSDYLSFQSSTPAKLAEGFPISPGRSDIERLDWRSILKCQFFEQADSLTAKSESIQGEKTTLDHLTDYFDAHIINPRPESVTDDEDELSEYEIEKKKFQEWKRKMDNT